MQNAENQWFCENETFSKCAKINSSENFQFSRRRNARKVLRIWYFRSHSIGPAQNPRAHIVSIVLLWLEMGRTVQSRFWNKKERRALGFCCSTAQRFVFRMVLDMNQSGLCVEIMKRDDNCKWWEVEDENQGKNGKWEAGGRVKVLVGDGKIRVGGGMLFTCVCPVYLEILCPGY